MRTIEVDIHDLDNVETAKGALRGQIEAVEADPASLETPVSFALDLSQLRQSGDPEERSLAEVVSAITELRGAVTTIDERLRVPEALLPPEYLAHALRRLRARDVEDLSVVVRHAEKQIRALRSAEDLAPDEREEALSVALAALEAARRMLSAQ